MNEREDSDLLARVGKEARLWGLAVVCATIGALAVWRWGLPVGVAAFLLSLVVLGIPLYQYEKRRGSR